MFNLSIICRTANSLHKAGCFRSNAFVIAWAMEKGMKTKVKGVSRENRQIALQHLLRYDPQDVSIRLEREPRNMYDQDAIAVIAAVLAPLIDAGKAVHSGFQGVHGGYLPSMSYGLVIQVRI